MNASAALHESPDYYPDSPRIWDARETDPGQAIRPEDLRAISNLPVAETTTGRIAIVVRRDIDFGMSRMFQAYQDLKPGSIQVFRDYAEASAWVTGGT